MRLSLLVLTVISLTIFMTGCAVLDLSTLETAMPISPARVQVSTFVASGLDLRSAVVIEEFSGSYVSPSHDDILDAIFTFTGGYKAGVSIIPKLDLIVEVYESCNEKDTHNSKTKYNTQNSSTTTGYKIGFKSLLSRKDKHYLALMPFFTIVNGADNERIYNNQYEEPFNRYYTNRFESRGIETQLLYTYDAGKVMQFTLAGKYNYNIYNEEYRSVKHGPYHIKHFGINGNMRITLNHVFLILELGQEFVPVVNGNLSSSPKGGICLGLKL